jgi:2-polyprenyl-3-methyl-5-hydroxy-6-metoxy-1,4-benzoquinol methylase
MKRNWKWTLAQQAEFKWWQAYLRKKEVSGYLENKKFYWDRVLTEISPFATLPAKAEILDAGCGPAGIFMNLQNYPVSAIDPLLEKYKLLAHFKPSDYPWVNFIQSPIEAIDYFEKFDVIFCMNAINHVNDINSCYDKLVRALKPGGILVISTDTHRNNTLKKIFQWIPGDILHPMQYNLSEYNKMLTSRGVTLIKDILFKRETIFDYYITIAKK